MAKTTKKAGKVTRKVTPAQENEAPALDWTKAEKHLQSVEAKHKKQQDQYFMLTVIKPLREKFDQGDRTESLHAEILALK